MVAVEIVVKVVCMPSRFSHVWLFATLWTVAREAPLSMGFSRQEHWSGLPFPPPMHESENESEVAQLCLTLSDPMDYQDPLSMGFSRQVYWRGVPLPSLKGQRDEEKQVKVTKKGKLVI